MTSIGAGAGPVRQALPGALALVALAMLLRALLMGAFPLCDTTESRYAAIGMNMSLSGDWTTPRMWYRGEFVPFWGKPPLHFWLTAASFRLFGLSETASRLPGWLAGLAMLGATFALARGFAGATAGSLAALLLASSGLFYVLSGTCTTDITMAAFLALAMLSFARAAGGEGVRREAWGLAFFASMAGAVMTKGPVALVLAGLSLAAYAFLARRWREFRALPWVTGSMLFVALVLPWFLAAERATPGFLRYYFVNEHFLRYIRHDYGDLYGAGHRQPWGAIWLHLAVGLLPWTVALARGVAGDLFRRARRRDPRILYALCWGLAPAVFFTLARQVLSTYVLPAVPGLAVAAALALAGPGQVRRRGPVLLATASFAFLAMAGAAFIGRPWAEDRLSTKAVVHAVARDQRLAGRPLSFPLAEFSSAEFYLRQYVGRDMSHHTGSGGGLLRRMVAEGTGELMALSRRQWDKKAPEYRDKVEIVRETPGWVVIQARRTR